MYPWVYPSGRFDVTRYPKSGKGRKWTVAELKAIPTTWQGDALSDGDGLVGTVRVNAAGAVSLHFRYGFKTGAKRSWHYCGTWPASSLESIRTVRNEARATLRGRINPNAQRSAGRIEEQRRIREVHEAEAQRATQDLPLQAMFDAWIADGVMRKDGNSALRRLFQKDLLPDLGTRPVKEITEHGLRAVLRQVVARGANRLAVVLHNDVRQMFAWAEKRQPWRRLLQEGNPALLIEIDKIVAPDYDLTNVRTRTLSSAEIGELAAIFLRMDCSHAAAANRRSGARPMQRESRLALWLCLSTLCRIGELLQAEWSHLDLAARTWHIPVENVKGTRGKKQAHQVHLSDFAFRQFSELQAITGQQRWCFPSRDGESHIDLKTISKQVGDRQQRFKQRRKLARRCNDDSLVLSGGTSGAWTPHDLRRTGATMMQALGVTPDIIDRCQNHVLDGSRVRRHYLMHKYSSETKQAWQRLGAAIEASLRPEGPVASAEVSTRDDKSHKTIAARQVAVA